MPMAMLQRLILKLKKDGIKKQRLQKDTSFIINQKEFHPGFVNVFENENCSLFSSPRDLYDSFAFVYSEKTGVSPLSYSGIYSIESGLVPVHNHFIVRIKAGKAGACRNYAIKCL